MNDTSTRSSVRTGTRPVPIGELLEAWLAVQRGDFRHGQARRASPVLCEPGGRWRTAPGEVTVLVAGCAGSVGASIVALLLAGAPNAAQDGASGSALPSARVVDCAPASCSALAGASTAELGEAGDGWLAGRRDTVRIERRQDHPAGPAQVPVPPAGVPGGLTVVDSWWQPRQLLDGGGWLADLARSCPRVVLVTRGSVPGMARLEAALNLLGPDRCWAVITAMPGRGRARRVERSQGVATVRLRRDGRLFVLRQHAGFAVSGITTEPSPRVFDAAAHQLLEGLLP